VSSSTANLAVRYDGKSWAYNEPQPGNFFQTGWWKSEILKRYGKSPDFAARYISAARATISSGAFNSLFSSFTDLIYSANLVSETQSTAQDFLKAAEVSTGFQRELLNSWVRGRYAQNLGTISAFGALMAADSGPLYTISRNADLADLWKRMVEASRAVVNLETRVDSLQKAPWGGWELTSSTPNNRTTTPYDAVILAAPFSLTSVSIPSLADPPANVTYEPVHITLFISPSRLSPHPFHGRKDIPDIVFTTPCSWEYDRISGESGQPGLGHPRYWSLSRIMTVIHEGERRWLYKVISATEMKQEDLQTLVGVGKMVSWVYRHYVSIHSRAARQPCRHSYDPS
jgi:hypothetical protein